MRIRLWLTALLGTALLATLLAAPARTQQADDVGGFMQLKLGYAQKVLEGLALEDFDAIGSNGQALELMSLEAGWKVLQTAEYARQSEEFRRATQALKRAADQKNLDGAALAYVDMTMKCINCHKYVRDAQ